VGNVRNDTTYNNWTEHWAIGNLQGLYGYGAATYGAAFGKYSAADYITIEATNGIRFLDSGDVVRAQLTAGVWTLGSVVGGEYINIAATGITMYGGGVAHTSLSSTGTFWAGDTSATERLQWDTTNGLQIFNNDNVAYVKFPTAGTAQISNFYIGANDLWGGNAAIGNVATTIVLGNLDGTSKIALGPTADAITIAGTESGFIADGGGNLRLGDVNSWLKWSGGVLDIKLASGEALTLAAGGDIILGPSDVDPSIIKWSTVHNIGASATAEGTRGLCIWPTTGDQDYFKIGYDPITPSMSRYLDISMFSKSILLQSHYDVDTYAFVDVNGTNILLDIEDGVTSEYFRFDKWGWTTGSHKTLDFCAETAALDDAWADDWHNVADFYCLDTYDDLAAIKAIQKSGEIDPRTGLFLIDDSTIPKWMLTKSKDGKETLYDPDGKPYLSLKMIFSVLMGSTKQLDARVEALEVKSL